MTLQSLLVSSTVDFLSAAPGVVYPVREESSDKERPSAVVVVIVENGTFPHPDLTSKVLKIRVETKRDDITPQEATLALDEILALETALIDHLKVELQNSGYLIRTWAPETLDEGLGERQREWVGEASWRLVCQAAI